MIENGPNLEEMGMERIPSPEEVDSVFRELSSKEYTETRRLEDDKGIYLWEVEVPGDVDGQVVEYAYMRKGHYDGKGILATEIHMAVYEDGIPVTGGSAARLVENKWQISIPEGWKDL